MRDIKFRAWDTKDKKMIFDGLGAVLIELTEPSDYKAGGPLPPIEIKSRRLIYQQYIGLHDKNGKEIYEGDIVRDDYDKIHPIKKIEYGGHWNYAAFGVSGKRKNKANWEPEWFWDCLTPEYCATIEVIGNIHENPEFMEGING